MTELSMTDEALNLKLMMSESPFCDSSGNSENGLDAPHSAASPYATAEMLDPDDDQLHGGGASPTNSAYATDQQMSPTNNSAYATDQQLSPYTTTEMENGEDLSFNPPSDLKLDCTPSSPANSTNSAKSQNGKKRSHIWSYDDRLRVIQSYKAGEDWQEVVQNLGMAKRTGDGLIKRYMNTGKIEREPMGGKRVRRFDEEGGSLNAKMKLHRCARKNASQVAYPLTMSHLTSSQTRLAPKPESDSPSPGTPTAETLHVPPPPATTPGLAPVNLSSQPALQPPSLHKKIAKVEAEEHPGVATQSDGGGGTAASNVSSGGDETARPPGVPLLRPSNGQEPQVGVQSALESINVVMSFMSQYDGMFDTDLDYLSRMWSNLERISVMFE